MRQPPSNRRSERRYFAWFAIFAATLVFVGFARTYYFHRFFHTPDLSRFLHVHAAVMTGWVVLFVLQTFLIRWHRTPLHRRFGYIGACYAVGVVVMGCTATFLSARREVRAQSVDAPSFLTVLALELTQMLLFASLVALAVYVRDRPDYHKRFMVLATLCMLPNPMVRLLVLVGMINNNRMLMVWAAGVVVIVAIDALRSGRLHKAFAAGAPIIVGSLFAAYFISNTAFWQSLAARVVR